VQAFIRPGQRDDGRAVLVVMEHRDVHELAQSALDDEAIGGADVLQVDAAEGGPEKAHRVDELVDVLRADSRSMESMSAKRLNSTALPSMTGLEARAPRLPRPRMAVPLEITATEIAARRVVEGRIRVLGDT
jgi:hypothetical protein